MSDAEQELDRLRRRLVELEKRIPRDSDRRPIVGILHSDGLDPKGAVHLSNWVGDWIADVAALTSEVSEMIVPRTETERR